MSALVTPYIQDNGQVQTVGNGLSDLVYHVLDNSFYFSQLEVGVGSRVRHPDRNADAELLVCCQEMKLTTVADKAAHDDGRPLTAHEYVKGSRGWTGP